MIGNVLYQILIVSSVWPILNGFLFDDQCEISPVGEFDKETTDIDANQSCTNGIVRWDYPRGSIRIRFVSANSAMFSVCFSEWLTMSFLRFFDESTGVEQNMTPAGENGNSVICTKPHDGQVMVRIQAPEILIYVAGARYQIKLV